MIKRKFYLIISLLIKIILRYYLKYISKKYQLERSAPARKPNLLFGTDPLISNKYWSNALKKMGYESCTVMSGFYIINKKEDYDLYFQDIFDKSTFKFKYFCSEYVVLSFILKNIDIVHISFNGFGFEDKWIKKNEIELLKMFGCRIIVLPYGGDFFQYSKLNDANLKHVLLINYPQAAIFEKRISENISYLTIKADIIIAGFQTQGIGRWDTFPYNIVTMDTDLFKIKPSKYNQNNGKNGVVKIVHTPNHRYIKGTEYLINAFKELKEENFLIELILLEKKPNDEVLRVLECDADILVEQLVLGYALSAIEGMAAGLPVLSNLSNEEHTRAFRRYSYLNECPILTTTPENIKENLRLLITNPDLRKEIGLASRKYVEKYHSNETAQYIFSKVYDKIWYKREVDLINMFHPLNPNAYNNQSPIIEHPLIENKIPETLLRTLKH